MVFAERDWKYLKRIHDEMLASLCAGINQQAADLLQSPAESEHAKYLSLYNHLRKSDDILAESFNDWRRSTIVQKAACLYRHGVLTQEHLAQLSPDAQECVRFSESLWKEKKKEPNKVLGTAR